MSNRLRLESDCLNCGMEVTDRFCSHCGQENTVHPESFSSMVRHYFDDLTHFDSKLFQSLWFLFSKPGHLTNVFNLGQRKKYVHPIRMYIFISVLTFTYLFFSTHNLQNPKLNLNPQSSSSINSNPVHDDQLIKVSTKDTVLNSKNWKVKLDSAIYEVDTAKTNNWVESKFKNLFKNAMISFRKDPDAFTGKFMQNMIHNLPKTLLVCLPFFALILYMVFYRKERFFTEHAIFSIHLHIYLLIIVLLTLILSNYSVHWLIYLLLFLYPPLYLYKSIRNVYKNGRLISFAKSILIMVLYFFVLWSVQLVNVLYSISLSNV